MSEDNEESSQKSKNEEDNVSTTISQCLSINSQSREHVLATN